MRVQEVPSDTDHFVSPTTPTEFAQSLEPSALEIASQAVKAQAMRPFRAISTRIAEAARSEAKMPQKLLVTGAFVGTSIAAIYFSFQPDTPPKPEAPAVASTTPVTISPLVKECLQLTVPQLFAEEDIIGAQAQIRACKQNPLLAMQDAPHSGMPN